MVQLHGVVGATNRRMRYALLVATFVTCTASVADAGHVEDVLRTGCSWMSATGGNYGPDASGAGVHTNRATIARFMPRDGVQRRHQPASARGAWCHAAVTVEELTPRQNRAPIASRSVVMIQPCSAARSAPTSAMTSIATGPVRGSVPPTWSSNSGPCVQRVYVSFA